MDRRIAFAVPVACLGFLLAISSPLAAAIVTMDLYRLGEDDPGAAAGQPGGATSIDAVGGLTVNRSGSPVYTSNTRAIRSSLALDFPASANYNRSPVISTLTDNFGIEAWVQTDGASGNATIAYNGNSSTSGWGLYRIGGNYQALFGGKALFGTSAATLGAWTHLAVVRDSGTATFYVNGTAAGTTTAAPNAAAGSFMIGGNLGGEYFDGRVDEVRVFRFDPGQFNPVSDLNYSTQTIVGHYRLGDNDGAVAPGMPGAAITRDDTGALHLNRGGSPTYAGSTPGPGTLLAMDFSGATGESYTAPSVATTATNNWILETWVNADTAAGTHGVVYNGNTSNSGFGIYQYGGEWVGLFGGVAFLDYNVPVVVDEWTHLALVRESGSTRLYVNGLAVGSSFAFVPNLPVGSFAVGSAPSGGEAFNGQLDEVWLSTFTGPFRPEMLHYQDAFVPEPSAWVLCLLGFGGLGIVARRRQLGARSS